MSAGAAMPTAPALAFLTQRTPASTESATARSRCAASSSGSSSITFTPAGAAACTGKAGFSFVLGATLALSSLGLQARQSATDAGSAVIARAELPLQGQQTHALILAGGPFLYEKDGVVFGNRERLLPPSKRGYYREYTVRTPGARHRGPKRIVCGGPPQQPEACYYTADHYASFRRIVD